ncbi:hypothetical protein BY996DRAFT_7155781 [Phakopsora pachyrhizi]|nr:hypothetical protein BY996DRAFT_7155781 [Phakopsora pachyrhizi]
MLNNQYPQHLASQPAVLELWAVVALAAWAVWEVLGASEALEGSVDSSKTTMPRTSDYSLRPMFHGMTIFLPGIPSESCF